MKKFILPAYLLLAYCGNLQAQEYGLHFMRDVWNAQYTNPGFMARQSFVLSLPSLHTSANIFGTSHAPIFRAGDTDGKYYINHAEILDGLKGDVNLKMGFGIETAGIGFKAGPAFISGFTNLRMSGGVNIPEDLLGVLWRGTTDYLDKTLGLGPSVNAMLYRETGVAASYSLTPRLSVGAQAKRLSGLAGFQTAQSKLQAMQSGEYYQTTFEADYLINYYAAGLIEPIETEEGPEGASDFADEFEFSDNDGPLSLLSGIPRQNGGWAFGLGAEMIVTPRLTVAASVVNLGAIRWKKGAQQIQLTQEAVTFNGLSFSDISPGEDGADLGGVTDSLSDKFSVQARAGTEFVQGLAPRSFLSATYDVGRFLSVGGLLHNEFGRYNTFTALALNARLRLGRIFSLGGVYAIQSNTYNTVGLNSMLKLGPLQFYMIMDNLSPLFQPERTSGTQLRLGLNLTFGRKKMEASIAQAKVWVPEQNPEWPEEEALAVQEEEEKPAGQPAAPQPVPANEPALPAQAAPQESAAPATPGFFVLDMNFLDEKTEAPLSSVYVDVYQVEQQGGRSLARTGRYLNGKVEMSLSPSAAAYEVRVRAAGYEETTLTFQPTAGSPLQKYWYLKEDHAVLDATEPAVPSTPEAAQPPREPVAAEEPTAPPPLAAEASPNRAGEEAAGPMKPAENRRPKKQEPNTAVSPGRQKSYYLQLEFRDKLSGALVEAAYVDVYKVPEQGEKTLVSTSRYPNGEFSLYLLLEEPLVYQINASAYGYEAITLDFTQQTVTSLASAIYMTPAGGAAAAAISPEPFKSTQPAGPGPAAEQPEAEEKVGGQPLAQLKVTERTSLRESATSQSAVLKRLGAGAEVALLERTNIYWWKVSYNGQVGWVKKALLQPL